MVYHIGLSTLHWHEETALPTKSFETILTFCYESLFSTFYAAKHHLPAKV